MRPLTGLLLAAVLLGCPKPQVSLAPSWDDVPRLPSPTAGTYSRSYEAPPDPPLARLVEGRRWEAALSGTAAGLALELIKAGSERKITRWQVREAAWHAGYPYPIDDARAWAALPDGEPPPQLLAWLEALPPDADLGLVRARGQEGDVWVALRASPRHDLGRLPRQVAEGGILTLPAVPGGTYAVADANGGLRTGSLEQPVELTTASMGEWLVRIEQADAPVAVFPVYVGLVPPRLPLITDSRAVHTPVEVIERTQQLLWGIRDLYGVQGLQRDFMLDAGARSLLRGGSTTSEGVMTSLGLEPAATALWQCEQATVEACVDALIWHPENRLALLDERSELGLAAEVTSQGVRLVGILSRTD